MTLLKMVRCSDGVVMGWCQMMGLVLRPLACMVVGIAIVHSVRSVDCRATNLLAVMLADSRIQTPGVQIAWAALGSSNRRS